MTHDAEVERLTALNERLVIDNAKLRQGILDACKRISILAGRCYLCEYHPHPQPDPAKAETVAIVRKSREHG